MKAYVIRNSLNGKVYIGITKSSVDERFKKHIRNARNSAKSALYGAIRKYGDQAFTVEHVASATSWANLCEVERALIRQHSSYRSECGYNLTKGGDGAFGNVMSPEARKRIGDASRGKSRPAHVVEAIRRANAARTISAEEKERGAAILRGWVSENGAHNRGKSISDKQREKLRLAWEIRRTKWPNGVPPQRRRTSAWNGISPDRRAERIAHLRSVAPKKHTEESKKKMSDAAKRRRRPEAPAS